MGISVSLPGRKWCIILLNIAFLSIASAFFVSRVNSADFVLLNSYPSSYVTSGRACKGLLSLDDYKAKCLFLQSHNSCLSEGYIDYLHIFYCNFGRFTFLGYFSLFLWLLVLFYMLGNTASEYFCSSLDNLSSLLKLSPTIAGVTLLSLGNGAPDVFASIVSFTDSGTGEIGFNTVIGGASFVTCIVVGVLSILVHKKQIKVHKRAFVRDICFFLLVLASFIFILFQGEINLWGAIGFVSMYIVYVILVYMSHIHWENGSRKDTERHALSCCANDLSLPILSSMEKGEVGFEEQVALEGSNEKEMKQGCLFQRLSTPCSMLLYILQMPLYLPRRLTIPVVCEKRWSKPIGVVSATLAPLLLSGLWILEDQNANSSAKLVVSGIGSFLGIAFGVFAYVTTEKSSPPKKCLFPWLATGFVMSMTWSYITAQELVALLVSLGYIFGISPSILGLTVLAWGNSLGDLITDLTMAMNGGPEGAQVAISGCYAGPIFNILFGLGMSMVGASWCVYPSSVVIPRDPYLLETIGFLAGGLIWALVVLPWRKMKIDRFLGAGLLALYLMAVSLRLIRSASDDS
ncbi:hypothetical protein K2173_025503 [Erythroxylum novogranatense]|uniref:Sodium/calcium exchanger membrane region domain-containing protein n=1 Tax=Erythroxylum novogranatense TaxID=1862640 RepID=A0AAV8TAB1_9ROSI|nr:hypothetical protein K2173_025503 [Erythroxylum novogranatense]